MTDSTRPDSLHPTESTAARTDRAPRGRPRRSGTPQALVATRVHGGTAPAKRRAMTPPRRVLPGTTYLVTRRCSERRFFLRPSRLTNDIFLYVLAVAARRYGVLVHAFCVLSNHCHLIVTDEEGRLPAFMQYLDSLVARAVNASLGHFESLWARDGSYSAVEPLDPADVLA